MNTHTVTNHKKSLFTTNQMVTISLLSALSYVLMLFHLPYKHLGFLEIEFSDIPAIIAALQFGPFSGVIVELIKNLIKALTATTTGYVGELANFLISSAYIIPVGILYKLKKNKSYAGNTLKFKVEERSGFVKSNLFVIVMFAIATITMSVTGALLNYYVTVPLFARLFGGMNVIVGAASAYVPAIKGLGGLIVFGITPYNILKGIAMSIIGYYTYRLLKGRILS